EASSVNNVAILPPQAPRAIKAIILEEEPRSEFRYLRQTLRRLPNLTLTTVLFSADPRVSQNDPEALAIQELPNLKLDDYDVIVLGRLSHNSARLLEEPLKALMANDDNSTALWLLHDAYRADDHSAWRPMEELLPSALAREPLPTRHNDTAWRWEIPQGARAIYGDAFCQRLRDAHGVDARPHDTRPATHAATQVILQICDEDQTSEPVLMLAQLNRHKIAWQARQELWPMQTLAEKDLYPEFIAKTLDFLTEDSLRTHVATYPPGGDSNQETTDINISPQVIDFPEDISEYLTVDSSRRERIAEQLDLAASSALLEETARLTNGKTLDLRDRNEEETLELASDFFEEILEKLPQHTTQTPRRLLPPDLSAILLLALILASWFLEKKRDFKRAKPR
ncbi:MAG: hypothetical protein Q4G03_10255, partial [Planctomycetia bacterium]|nr:hypothetical protein [Planctomycetia bacterium]